MNFQAEVNEQLNLSVPREAKVHEGSLVAAWVMRKSYSSMDSHHSDWRWASAVFTDSRCSRQERGSGILYISSFDNAGVSCSHLFQRVVSTFWYSQGERGLPGPEGPEGAKGEPGLKGVKVSKWWIMMMLLKMLNIPHPVHVSSRWMTFLFPTIVQGVSRTCWNRRRWTKRGFRRKSTFTLETQNTNYSYSEGLNLYVCWGCAQKWSQKPCFRDFRDLLVPVADQASKWEDGISVHLPFYVEF